MTRPLDQPQHRRISAWICPAIVAAVAIAMLIYTWGAWIDVLVDFGVQLYVPWRLTAGDVLYRDIAHYTGPLSVYYNALAFAAMGVSLRTLVLANLPVLAGIIVCVYWIALKLGGRLAATICGVSFVVLFGMGHITRQGNYNDVCPYEYEYTHATLLCLLEVIFLWRLLNRRRATDAAAAGFCIGLVFLTRSEFFVAAIATAALAGAFLALGGGGIGRCAAALLGAMLAPIAVSVGLLSLAMPARLALHGTLGMWPALLHGSVTGQHFYQHSMGTDELGRSLLLLAAWTGTYAIAVGLVALWASLTPRQMRLQHAMAAGILAAALLGWWWEQVPWISFFRPLPVIAAAVVIGAICRRAELAALLGMLALALLPKIFFYARIEHYGVWLAMPATMLLLIALFGWLPKWIAARGGQPAVMLGGLGSTWAVVLAVHVAITVATVQSLHVTVGQGADAFLADERGRIVNHAVEFASRTIPRKGTLDCFPEGIMINYLSRRRASTPYVNFNPPDLLLFGEGNMVAALQATPPDFVMLVDKDTREFGVQYFGRDYGRKLYAWIVSHYQPVTLEMDLGAEPLKSGHFGIRVWVPREGR